MSDDNADPITRWVLVARNLMGAYGVFPSEAAAWDWAKSEKMNLELYDTIPLVNPFSRVDKEAFRRSLRYDDEVTET